MELVSSVSLPQLELACDSCKGKQIDALSRKEGEGNDILQLENFPIDTSCEERERFCFCPWRASAPAPK